MFRVLAHTDAIVLNTNALDMARQAKYQAFACQCLHRVTFPMRGCGLVQLNCKPVEIKLLYVMS